VYATSNTLSPTTPTFPARLPIPSSMSGVHHKSLDRHRLPLKEKRDRTNTVTSADSEHRSFVAKLGDAPITPLSLPFPTTVTTAGRNDAPLSAHSIFLADPALRLPDEPSAREPVPDSLKRAHKRWPSRSFSDLRSLERSNSNATTEGPVSEPQPAGPVNQPAGLAQRTVPGGQALKISQSSRSTQSTASNPGVVFELEMGPCEVISPRPRLVPRRSLSLSNLKRVPKESQSAATRDKTPRTRARAATMREPGERPTTADSTVYSVLRVLKENVASQEERRKWIQRAEHSWGASMGAKKKEKTRARARSASTKSASKGKQRAVSPVTSSFVGRSNTPPPSAGPIAGPSSEPRTASRETPTRTGLHPHDFEDSSPPVPTSFAFAKNLKKKSSESLKAHSRKRAKKASLDASTQTDISDIRDDGGLVSVPRHNLRAYESADMVRRRSSSMSTAEPHMALYRPLTNEMLQQQQQRPTARPDNVVSSQERLYLSTPPSKRHLIRRKAPPGPPPPVPPPRVDQVDPLSVYLDVSGGLRTYASAPSLHQQHDREAAESALSRIPVATGSLTGTEPVRWDLLFQAPSHDTRQGRPPPQPPPEDELLPVPPAPEQGPSQERGLPSRDASDLSSQRDRSTGVLDLDESHDFQTLVSEILRGSAPFLRVRMLLMACGVVLYRMKFFRPPPARADHQRVTSLEAGVVFANVPSSETGSIRQEDESPEAYHSDLPTGLAAPLETTGRDDDDDRLRDTTESLIDPVPDSAKRESFIDPARDSRPLRMGGRKGSVETDSGRPEPFGRAEGSLPSSSTQPLSTLAVPTPPRPRPAPLQMPQGPSTWASSSFAELIFADSDGEEERGMVGPASGPASGPSPPPTGYTPSTSWHGSPASSRSRRSSADSPSDRSDYGDHTFGPTPPPRPPSRDDSPFLDCSTTPRNTNFRPPVGSYIDVDMPGARPPSEQGDRDDESYTDHGSFIDFDDPNSPVSPVDSDSVGPLPSAGLENWPRQSASYRRSLLSVAESSSTSPGGHRVSLSSLGAGSTGNRGGAMGGRASFARSNVSLASAFSAISDFPEPPSYPPSVHELGRMRSVSLPSLSLSRATHRSTETGTSVYTYASTTQDGGAAGSRVSVRTALPTSETPGFDRPPTPGGASTPTATSFAALPPPPPPPLPSQRAGSQRWSGGAIGRDFMEFLRRRPAHQTHVRTSSDPQAYSTTSAHHGVDSPEERRHSHYRP
jgi:hypothetical protein